MPTERATSTAQKQTSMTSTDSEPTMDEITKTLEAASLAESKQKPPTTLSSLFAITEIGEQILLQMDPLDVYNSMQVNSRWKSIVDGSSALQQHIFLTQAPGKHDLTRLRDWHHINDGVWKPNTIICPLNDGVNERLKYAKSDVDDDESEHDDESEAGSKLNADGTGSEEAESDIVALEDDDSDDDYDQFYEPQQDDKSEAQHDDSNANDPPDADSNDDDLWEADYPNLSESRWKKLAAAPYRVTPRRNFTHPLFRDAVLSIEFLPEPVMHDPEGMLGRFWGWCDSWLKGYRCNFVVRIFPARQWLESGDRLPERLPPLLENMFLSDQPTFQYLQIVDLRTLVPRLEPIWPGMRLIDVLHLVQQVTNGRLPRLPRLEHADVEPWYKFAKSIGIKLMPVRIGWIEEKTYSLD